jgi:hypothetical protein
MDERASLGHDDRPIKEIRFTAYEEWIQLQKEQHEKEKIKYINARRTKAQIKADNEKKRITKQKNKEYQ